MGVSRRVGNKPVIYLAGAIRDNKDEDIAWREQAIGRLYDVAQILNPLAGKSFDPDTGKWLLFGNENPDARYIVQADFWCVDRADIILFNFASLADKYPSLGTLTEFGRSTARPILRLAIVGSEYQGHENTKHFPGLHPFLAENCAKVFGSPAEAIAFTRNYCLAVTQSPRFRGSTMVDLGKKLPPGSVEPVPDMGPPAIPKKWVDPWPDPKWQKSTPKHVCGAADYDYAVVVRGYPPCEACVAGRANRA